MSEANTYCAAIAEALTRWPDRPAFVHPGLNEHSYAQTGALIARMTNVFAGHGLGRGSGIGILARNCAEAWMASQAIQFGRGYYVSLPWRSSFDDLAYIIADSDIRAVVVQPEFAAVAARLAAACPTLRIVFTLGPAENAHDLLTLAADVAPAALDLCAPDDICVLWYTGGTTGRPKGAIHSQATVLAAVERNVESFELPDDVRYLAAAPLSHGGWTFVAPTLLSGGTIVVMDAFDPDRFIALANAHAITLAVGVPTMLYAILDAVEAGGGALPKLERFVYGGAPISPTQLARAQRLLGNILTQYYGQSEILGAACALRATDHDAAQPGRLASCGQPVPGVEVVLLDDDATPVGADDVGELCFRTRSAMLGYWKQPELTAQYLRDGWVHSGDLGRRATDGFITLVDRKKDMIVSGGFNVYPSEIEAVLEEHADVGMAAVIGVPDSHWGEAVTAIVVPAIGARPDAVTLTAHVRARKGGVNTPKSIEFVSALPLTAAGKIDKKALRRDYWQAGERLIG